MRPAHDGYMSFFAKLKDAAYAHTNQSLGMQNPKGSERLRELTMCRYG
jgi:hypothetical protein